jgi:hypothetical protein
VRCVQEGDQNKCEEKSGTNSLNNQKLKGKKRVTKETFYKEKI